MSANRKDSAPHGDKSGQNTDLTGNLRALIRECTDIPSDICDAAFARVDERKMDKSLLRRLTEGNGSDNHRTDFDATTQRRSAALSPFLGRTLVCVLIRMPGVSYTIEIDPVDERVVHWEWQPT